VTTSVIRAAVKRVAIGYCMNLGSYLLDNFNGDTFITVFFLIYRILHEIIE